MMSIIGILGFMAMAPSPGGGQGGQQSFVSTLVPLLVIFAIFYFLMIRPQQRQQKKHKEMLGALKKGDRVVTRGGIMGTVHGITDNVITVEVAENVRIKLSRDAISAVQTSNSQS